MNSFLVTAAVCCMAIGAGVSSLPQHRFSQPIHFSYRTVHTPSVLAHPFPSPNNVAPPFSSPSNVGVVEGPVQPSFVPVVVPVSQDFPGDSVVVTREDLPKLGLVNVQAPQIVETPEGMGTVEAASAGSLSAVDDSFSLTAQAQEPAIEEQTPLEVVDPTPEVVDPTLEVVDPTPEVVNPTPEVVDPIAEQAPTPISPFETETYKAYDNFINTWLRLASVNLNRPDLLNLVSTQPRNAVAPEVVTGQTPVQDPINDPSIVESTAEAVVMESMPVVEVGPEAEPKDTAPTVQDTTSTAQEPQLPVKDTIVQELPQQPVIETTSSVQELPQQPPVAVEDLALATTADQSGQLPVAETVQPVAETAQPVAETVQNQFAEPLFTSRGRFSGFRYRFSHVPQSGTVFFNSIAG